MLTSSGHSHTDQEARCVTKKVVAIFVYSTILFLPELRAPFSKWLGSIQILNTVEWNPMARKYNLLHAGKIKERTIEGGAESTEETKTLKNTKGSRDKDSV